jgi:hypothetical protein
MFAHLKFGLSIIFLFLITGCMHPVEDRALTKFERNDKLHAHQKRGFILQKKLRSYRALILEDIYDEQQIDRERSRQTTNIAAIAASMEMMGDDILNVQKKFNLDASQASVFIQYAERLKKQARALGESAKMEQSNTYPSMIRAMMKTCNSCHRKFRTYDR